MLHYIMCNNSRSACAVVPQECTMKVQEGKFKLQDLLVVPMQRVLKYHLLLKVGDISSTYSTVILTEFNAGEAPNSEHDRNNKVEKQ